MTILDERIGTTQKFWFFSMMVAHLSLLCIESLLKGLNMSGLDDG